RISGSRPPRRSRTRREGGCRGLGPEGRDLAAAKRHRDLPSRGLDSPPAMRKDPPMKTTTAVLAALAIVVPVVAATRGRAQPAAAPGAASAALRADQPGPVVNRNVYGHFAEHLGRGIYEGIWVGPSSPIPNTRGIRNDVLAALKELKIPVLRWPGGCFADEYHWKDGIGPRDKRPSMINTHSGAVSECNT